MRFCVKALLLSILLGACGPRQAVTSGAYREFGPPLPSFTSSPADRQESRAIERYIAARVFALRATDDSKKTVSYLEEVAAQHPELASVQIALAEQYLRMQQLDRALETVEKAQALDPQYIPAFILHTRLLVLINQAPRAIAELEGLRRRVPPDEEVYTSLARLYMQEQQYPRAIQTMQEYLRREPESLTAYYYLGTLYGTHLHQYDRALTMFRRLVDLQPENIPARKALVQIHLARNDLPNALRELLQLEQHAVGDLSVQLRIAVLYYELKKYDAAITRIEAVLTKHPRANKLRYYLGVIYEESGQFAKAHAAYAQLPPSSSYFKDAVMRMAAQHTREHQVDAAIAVLDEALRRNGDVSEFYEYLAYLYQEKGDDPGAIRVMRRAVHHFAAEPRFHYALGVLYERVRNRSKAVRSMLNVLKYQPDNVYALNYVAYIYTERGAKLNEAEAMLHRAIEIRPDDGHILDSLGWLYYHKGEYEKALDLLERADALSPDEPAILRHIAQTLIAMGQAKEALAVLERAKGLASLPPVNVEELEAIQQVAMSLQGV